MLKDIVGTFINSSSPKDNAFSIGKGDSFVLEAVTNNGNDAIAKSVFYCREDCTLTCVGIRQISENTNRKVGIIETDDPEQTFTEGAFTYQTINMNTANTWTCKKGKYYSIRQVAYKGTATNVIYKVRYSFS